ncbi:DUF3078 domain-containing protein [Mucilaginibacter sp. UR6-11]|uniref:DUF3078 domain-containing protein n=1 Tax=Mucilaginibacter sp. UR6-11 TaxID=1435644 RepID=UPI001E2DDEC7|nr:DUF3078 domain-containing protein [Mucilaginibacter sp. UR6-11]MCC8424547.1 DUF3078 domain-containing protein [Mucilaginibacter sp. UR6-11]
MKNKSKWTKKNSFLCLSMLKNLPGYIVVIGLLTAVLPAAAQNADSLKKDSVKLDTAVINKYHIDPRKNSLPVRTRSIQIKQEIIPVSMLDYRVSYWRKWISLGINFNQAAFSNHYSSGGTNAIALGANFDYRTEYRKGALDYVGELNFIYGKSKNKGQGSRKSNDRLFLDNKIATQLSKSWFFFGSLTFESQFDKGYIYDDNGPSRLISNFMAPGYLTESVGFEFKPKPYFDLRIGTGTARQTFVVDTTLYHNQGGNYGVPIGKKFHNDLAFQVVAVFDKDIARNMHLNARYALFIPYEKRITFITHRVDAVLAARVNRLISVTINGTFTYDKTANPKPQGTESMALGILYRFPY